MSKLYTCISCGAEVTKREKYSHFETYHAQDDFNEMMEE